MTNYRLNVRCWRFGFLAAVAACAQPVFGDVKLEGIPITQRDYIACRVFGTVGKVASIDIGFAQGLELKSRLWVFRDTAGGLYRSDLVSVERVFEKTATVMSDSTRKLKNGDICVIATRDLDIWNNRGRESDIEFRRILTRRGNRGYDTRKYAVDKEQLLRQIEDDRQLTRYKTRKEKLDFRPEGPALLDITELRKLGPGVALKLGSDPAIHFPGVDFAKGRVIALDPAKLANAYRMRRQVVASRLDRKVTDLSEAEFQLEDKVDPLGVYGYAYYGRIIDFLRPKAGFKKSHTEVEPAETK